MRLSQILLLVLLPAAVAQADCGRLSSTDTYEKPNQILECLESKISVLQNNVTNRPPPIGNDPVKQSIGSEEVENNNLFPEANLILLGQRVRGKIAKPEDRDFYKFRTASQTDKFRVILRKLSASGFWAIVTIYNVVEEPLAGDGKEHDTPVSMLVESKPDAFYYVSVKSGAQQLGDYEPVVREEQ